MGVDEGLFGQTVQRGVVGDPVALHYPVVAMVGVAVQGDVGHDADLGRGVLDGLDAVGNQAVGVGCAGADRILDRAIDIGEQSHHRNAEVARLDRRRRRRLGGKPKHAGHGGDRDAILGPVMDDQRPDQIGRRQGRFRHQPPHPRAGPQAARTGEREGGGLIGKHGETLENPASD
jgi:hypothetical protein